MTPKEKAFHLYSKYMSEVIADNVKAKQCALIAVDFARGNPINTEEYNNYLYEVKQELELL